MPRKKSTSKYLGMIVDGKWKVVNSYSKGRKHTYYTLQNMYNNQTVVIVDDCYRRIVKGLTSVSSIISHRIKKEQL